MADYDKYVDKKHEVYSKMSEKMALVQSLLSDEESPLRHIGEDKIRQFQIETNFKYYENAIIAWTDAPDGEKDTKYKNVKNVENSLKSLVLVKLIPETQQYFYLNKIYFSEHLCAKIAFLIEEMENFNMKKFNMNDNERETYNVNLKNMILNIDKLMNEVIRLIRKELSADVPIKTGSPTEVKEDTINIGIK